MGASRTEQERLFRHVKHSLGAPVRQIELTDDIMCTLLEIAIENYSQYVQEWLIEHQWTSLLGQNVTTTDIAFALTTRSIDYESQFTYAYSKQVGLQQRGPWELKKDYVEIEAGRQVYQIPAGREINEELWFTPSSTAQALFSNYGGFGSDAGFGACQRLGRGCTVCGNACRPNVMYLGYGGIIMGMRGNFTGQDTFYLCFCDRCKVTASIE